MLTRSLKPKKCRAPKVKPCKVCRKPFTMTRPIQPACSWQCEHILAVAKVEAAARKRAAMERKATKEKLEEHKKLPFFIAAAQREFNKFVRARDAKQPCICCGKFTDDKDLLTGSRWDAGHYRSTGSASHLRFNENNAHRQLVRCNRHGAGRAVDYRIGLIKRIGLAAVEALEADNAVHKWTREELLSIKTTYRAKLRELMKKEPA